MRRKSRIIEGHLRRSPRKFSASTSRALPNLLSQSEKGNGKSSEPKDTAFETYSDSGENGDDVGIGVAVVETEANSSPLVGNDGGDGVDLGRLGLGICIKCDIGDELVLVCGEIGCSITVHQRCLGCDPSFDESGKFRCPVCEQKLAVSRVEEARKKVMEAKRALVRFLNGGFGGKVGSDGQDRFEGNSDSGCFNHKKAVVQRDRCVDNGSIKGSVAKETTVEVCLADMGGPESVEEERKRDFGEDREMGLGSNEGAEKRVNEGMEGMELEASDVSEKNESGEKGEELELEESDELGIAKEMSEAKTTVECSKRFKQTAGKRVNLRNRSIPNRTSPRVKAGMLRRKAIAKKNPSNSFEIESFPRSKRKRLHWTSEEEQILREGVQEITQQGSKNVSWKSVLEFGRQVFDPTRTPDDLKDKWRNMLAKQT